MTDLVLFLFQVVHSSPHNFEHAQPETTSPVIGAFKRVVLGSVRAILKLL